jgi:hypothetical protein
VSIITTLLLLLDALRNSGDVLMTHKLDKTDFAKHGSEDGSTVFYSSLFVMNAPKDWNGIIFYTSIMCSGL